ncbi:MAG: PhzF family phenazine biosynthesis protein [Gemmatimonadaceae bacterium]|nr:PhzF family phenazine biosynthesis protein [Chitinophagaceae bacterium]
MKIPIYQVDAFGDRIFHGNPAAVCILEDWLSDDTMQNIAMENNLSETAFLVLEDNGWHIRWFTPSVEVKLCGHATLASAQVLFQFISPGEKSLSFHCKSGLLKVDRTEDGVLTLDFPSNPPELLHSIPRGIFEGLGVEPVPVYKTSFDYMVVLPSQRVVESLSPDFKQLALTPCRGVIATSKGESADFVSRCFYPQSGIDEDPVTGSAHTIMIPFWSAKLGKTKMKAIQLSKRRGYLDCELVGDRVKMSGRAVVFMKGDIIAPIFE